LKARSSSGLSACSGRYGSGFGSGRRKIAMGSIYQRTTGGTWYYQWYKGNKLFKKSLKTKSRTEAKRLKVRLDAQVDTMKTGLAPKRVGIVEAFKRFYRSKEPLLKPGCWKTAHSLRCL
jgi:hypothetical protein